jgi:methylmalonyl-CoA/ethylmalonyl-CoA epimerase
MSTPPGAGETHPASAAYKLDHVGVAVSSIEGALAIYRALGLEESRRERVPGQKVIVSFLPVGDSRIELLEPTAADSPVSKFLSRRGPGVHHLCFAVPSIEAALADLSTRGFRLVDASPVLGADGQRVAFLHPEAGGGVLVELSERPAK